MTRKLRVLLIGPLPRSGVSVGGTQISFAALVESLRARSSFDVDVIDTSRAHGYVRDLRMRFADAAALCGTVVAVLRRGRASDAVVFNASPGGMLLGGPLLWLAARCIRRPFVARVFGGSFDRALERSPRPWRALVERTVLRSDLLLLQTAELCRRFGGVRGVRHMPTARPMPQRVPRDDAPCRRFLFLSQLRPEKGVVEALGAIELTPAPCTLSVAGPLLPGVDLAELLGGSRSRYLGCIEPERVSDLLAAHDVLVFPSYWEGEGLPGVVVEALQHGLPVIATRWRSIPEVVAHGVNGLLVEPRSTHELARAMALLSRDDQLFFALRRGALESGRAHSTEHWAERFEQWITEAVRGVAPVPSRSALTAAVEPRSALPGRVTEKELSR